MNDTWFPWEGPPAPAITTESDLATATDSVRFMSRTFGETTEESLQYHIEQGHIRPEDAVRVRAELSKEGVDVL